MKGRANAFSRLTGRMTRLLPRRPYDPAGFRQGTQPAESADTRPHGVFRQPVRGTRSRIRAMEIKSLSKNLSRDELGIWRCARRAPVSYPADGHARCFPVEDASFWFRHRNQCIVAAIQRFPPGGTILDIGGGNGIVSRGLIDAGFDTVLLEPGADGARNAKAKRRIPEVICATLAEADLSPGVVPSVGLFDVLEHIEDDRGFVRDISEALLPGGMLYVTVPAHPSLWSAYDIETGHYRRYRKRTLTAVLGDDFDVLYFTHFFMPLVVPVIILRTIPFRLGLVRRTDSVGSPREHGIQGGPVTGMLGCLVRKEAGRLRQGRSIGIGTSCLAVARKRKA
ncbi:MAG: methyltransferase domain-containing protein [Chitinivibrionales bacterium]|nr:methyltransferase domain-containing protein [Chitinivibrionales bacterium]MBD3396839.1 methyltransferase domain-containing protein [Chitinivibrionales bacterium]